MEINKYDDKSKEELHNILDKKKGKIEDIKEKINLLEEELKTLELKEKKINTKTKKILRKIIITLIYNIVYLIVVMSYIYPFINGFKVADTLDKTIYIVELYTGITIISLTVAILSVKIENKINERRKAIHNYLLNKIEEKTNEIKLIKQKEVELEKEIDEIRNSLKKEPQIKNDILNKNGELQNIIANKEMQTIPKTRKKTKNKNNNHRR